MKGKLIVIDGTDGSGKATQINLLTKALKAKKKKVELIDFPRYTDNMYGKLVRDYLDGKFGGVDEVDPYLASLTYAGDRLLAKPLIEKWLLQGKIVLSNRYVPSSKAHQSAKMPEQDQEKFMQWLDDLEYKTNKIPREDLVIFLTLPPEIGQKNVEKRGIKKDIHEASLTHLTNSSKAYLKQANMDPKKWVVIKCSVGTEMRSREDIHQEIMKVLEKKGIV